MSVALSQRGVRSAGAGTYRPRRMLERSQNVQSVKVNTDVGLFLLGKDPEDLPASGASINAVVGEGLCEDDVDDLFAEQQFSALGVSDNVGDGSGGGCPRFPLGALEILDNWENLALAE